MGQRIVILFSMNKSIIIIFLFSVLISCSKSEDSLYNFWEATNGIGSIDIEN